jgi:hypothetical protein
MGISNFRIIAGVASVIVLSFYSCCRTIACKPFSTKGAWSIVEVLTVKPDGTQSSTFPTEGLAIFADNHYSFCWMNHSSTIRNWQLPDSIKLTRFNQSIINTGTFELRDSILTTKANMAMSVMFTNGVAKFRCSFSGDTLVLRGLSVVSSENIAHPAYANGAYFVSKLVKIVPVKTTE